MKPARSRTTNASTEILPGTLFVIVPSGFYLLVLETDKATLEVPSPVAGRLVRIRKQKGERVQIGEVLAEIEPLDPAPAAS